MSLRMTSAAMGDEVWVELHRLCPDPKPDHEDERVVWFPDGSGTMGHWHPVAAGLWSPWWRR